MEAPIPESAPVSGSAPVLPVTASVSGGHGRRRRRIPISCARCRRSKIRCNKESPCSACVRARQATCVYETGPDASADNHDAATARPGSRTPAQRPGRHHQLEPKNLQQHLWPTGAQVTTAHPSLALRTAVEAGSTGSTGSDNSSKSATNTHSSTKSPSPASQSPSSATTIASLKDRIRELEEQAAKATAPNPPPENRRQHQHQHQHQQQPLPVVAAPQQPPETEQVNNFFTGNVHCLDRSVVMKTRVFGQSHWMQGAVLFKDLFRVLDGKLATEAEPQCKVLLEKCKALGRSIKHQRRHPGLGSATALTSELPPRAVADALLDGYLRTSESLFRVVHIPSFKKAYEAFWLSGQQHQAAQADPVFVLQLKLAMVIGSVVYPDRPALRIPAIPWIQEAQAWVAGPDAKSRLTIPALQVMVLLCFARQALNVGGDLIWISAGTMLRSAMCMGLHRDPARLPRRTCFAAEMRRRLWNTIVEVAVQASFGSGGPPLISLSDFDTEPPGNFDDDQLVETDKGADPLAQAPTVFTQMSVALALRETLRVRLAIAKFLNDIHAVRSYAETIRYDGELKAAYRTLSHTLQSYPADGPSPSSFQLQVLDFIIRHHFLPLHLPFLGEAMRDSTFAYSRKVSVETSLRLWNMASSPTLRSPHSSTTAAPASTQQDVVDDDFARLTRCQGAGLFRNGPMQANLFIALELRTQLLEDDHLGHASFRPDLLQAVRDIKAYALDRVRAGDTNIKGYVVGCIISAQIEGLLQRLPKEEADRSIVRTVEEAERTCLALLEQTYQHEQSRLRGDGDKSGTETDPLADLMTGLNQDWEMQDNIGDLDVPLDFGNADYFFGSGWTFADPFEVPVV